MHLTNVQFLVLLFAASTTAAAAGAQAEVRAVAAGEGPSAVRRAGHDAEAFERHGAHYGQAPDRAMRVTLARRLQHLTDIEPTRGWQERAIGRARREGVLP